MRAVVFLFLAVFGWPGISGCATNALDYPGSGEAIFADRNIGQSLTIGVMRNASVPETEDENHWLLLYLRNLELFGQVKWVDHPASDDCDYVLHCSIACTPHSALYRERYVIALVTLGIPLLLGVPTHDSYAHYYATFLVYRRGQCQHSYLLYNRRQYWWDNIYWTPQFTSKAAYAPLFGGFLYLFGRDYRASVW